jgi:hypothetical protein
MFKKPVVKETIKLKSKAHQKPLTENPSTNLSVKIIIPAFITSKNNPNEKMVMGMVKMVNMGFTIEFINANTKATNNEVIKLSTCTPGNKLAAIKTATAFKKILIIKVTLN